MPLDILNLYLHDRQIDLSTYAGLIPQLAHKFLGLIHHIFMMKGAVSNEIV